MVSMKRSIEARFMYAPDNGCVEVKTATEDSVAAA
jgi:hypothetical protein